MNDDTISRAAAIDAVRKAKDKSEAHRMLVQLPPTQLSVSKMEMVGDAISGQALLDAVDGVPWYHQNKNGEMVHGANSDEHQAWYKAEDIYHVLDTLPPAQPEQFNPCTVCQEFDCTGCKFRRTIPKPWEGGQE